MEGNGGIGQESYYKPGNPAQVANRMPQVTSQIDSLSKLLPALHARLDELEGRMTAILRPVGPEGQGNAKDRLQAVPLAEEIAKVSLQVESAIRRIQSLIERVEL